MPIHDWTRVDAGVFHDFHCSWVPELKKALNAGLLPPDYYALAEKIAGRLGPDDLTLHAQEPSADAGTPDLQGTLAVSVAPPRVKLAFRHEVEAYAWKRRSIVIRHSSNHRIVAVIEVLSPGNKASRHAVRALLDKAVSALDQGIHLLLLDLHPAGPRDPQGIHGLLWEVVTGEPYQRPTDKPLTLAAYVGGPVRLAYVEPVAVGDALPDIPLFLDPEQYVYVPLEAKYQAAYASVPRYYRKILDAPAT
jgi:hypothetical protein